MTYSVPVALPRADLPVVDPKTGEINMEWYAFFEALRDRTGGDDDAVDGAGKSAAQANDGVKQVNQDVEVLKEGEIVAGRGLEGGGTVGEGARIDAKSDDGWVFSTGTGDKSTPYSPPSTMTGNATYDPSQITTISSELSNLSKRYVAMEQALRSTEALSE